MARVAGTSVQNSFIKGRITEASGLNFPENAVTDESNCVFTRNGKVRRRKGIDFENGYAEETLTSTGVSSAFLWQAVGINGSKSFTVTQIGSNVYFWSVSGSSLSAGFESFSIDLTSYKSDVSITTQDIRESRASFSYGFGYLFIAHRYCEPLYVKYNSASNTITISEIDIKIRDFEGVEDGLEVSERPNVLSLEHEYNLQNQGWNYPAASSSLYDPIAYWDSFRTDIPSNTDIWWVYKDASEILHHSVIDRFELGNTPAAKGHYIYPAFNIQKAIIRNPVAPVPSSSSAPGVYTLVESKTTIQRPQFTQFYAGRVWWAGVKAEGFASKVYYSKVVEKESDFGICHMVNDPTAEFTNDLLPTDGGVIVIPELSEIRALLTIGSTLLVFASNGIWSISGSLTEGFSADSYTVSKVSEIGCLSPFSIVSIDGAPLWWTVDGIYALESGQGSFNTASLTAQTIQDFYDNIPTDSKYYAQGIWNKLERTITWIYRSTSASTFEDNFKYDSCLIFNIDTKAFYTYSFSNSTPKIRGIINTSGEVQVTTIENVTDSLGVVVTTSAAANVTSNVTTVQNLTSVDKFFTETPLTSTTGDWTWSQLRNTSYLDWYSYDSTGVSFSSYFTSGYVIRGDSIKDFQTNFITVTSEVEANSSFYISGRWGYSIDETSNLYTTRQQGYKSDSTRSYTQKRLRFRGMGKVLQYRVESETSKPFNIVGWATFDTANKDI